jgi:hypothetical protein
MQPLVGYDTPRYRPRRWGAYLFSKINVFQACKTSPEQLKCISEKLHKKDLNPRYKRHVIVEFSRLYEAQRRMIDEDNTLQRKPNHQDPTIGRA